jgi:1-acyl-sn-glycerol-3-phosphate acyltransferase
MQRQGWMKIIARNILKYIPSVGTVVKTMGFVFLSRNWQFDKTTIEKAFYHLKIVKEPFWLFSHPEGTRFSLEKMKKSHDYARKIGGPILRNVLLPRVRGLWASIYALHDEVDAIYDLTIQYRKPPPNIFVAYSGLHRPIEMDVYIRRIPIKEIPIDEKGVEKWLWELYQWKDQLIDQYKKEGRYPGQEVHPLPEDYTRRWWLQSLWWYVFWIPPLLIYPWIWRRLYTLVRG